MKKFNKMTALLYVIAISAAFFFSCEKKADGPIGALNAFCGAMKEYDFEKMKTYVNSKFAKAMSDPSEKLPDSVKNYLKESSAKMKYSIKVDEVKDDKAKASVTFKYVDASPVLKAAAEEMAGSALKSLIFGKKTSASQMLEDAINEKKQSVKAGEAEKTIGFSCTKTDAGWLIDGMPHGITEVLACNADDLFSDILKLL